MDLLSSSSLELFQLHCQQSGSLANTNTNQPRQSSPHDNHHSWIGGGGLIQKKPQGSANWPERVEIGRSCRGITRSSLASYSLWSHGRQRYKANQHKSVLRVAEQGELMPQPPPTVCGAIFIFFPPKITLSLSRLLQQNILSPVSASAQHPLTAEIPKKPEISTSVNGVLLLETSEFSGSLRNSVHWIQWVTGGG